MIRRFSGHLAHSAGDDVVAYFGYPQAGEGDAEGALRAEAIGFRIREESGRHILTIKGPTGRASDGALSDRVELEMENVAAIVAELMTVSVMAPSW